MAQNILNDCIVTVTIEMGHQANFLKEPSPEGFTHSWTVFVRGFEGSLLDYFVEKVVFRLHKAFKSPVKVITEPPFQVTECGYAGFILPVEIYFKNRQTPRNIVFEYDLFLNAMNSPPINNVRYEKLKFQNPTPEFKAKLIKAGGLVPPDTEMQDAVHLGPSPFKIKMFPQWLSPLIELSLLVWCAPLLNNDLHLTLADEPHPDVSPLEIGDITGVQPYTIKRVYESIRPKAVVLFPADFQFSTPVENLPTN